MSIMKLDDALLEIEQRPGEADMVNAMFRAAQPGPQTGPCAPSAGAHRFLQEIVMKTPPATQSTLPPPAKPTPDDIRRQLGWELVHAAGR